MSYCDPSAGICGGVMSCKARHSPDFGRILNHRPYVLMHADGLTATRPPGVCGGERNVRSAITTLPACGRIQNRTLYPDLAFSCMRDGLTANRPLGVCGGVA
ncbi:hypothetical protein TNCT_177371 [Trichonephila clavata]|uniref:Uncharacterized protein n=1 Tax=Trichonephila clavata TaxID=2740835 RepID=A0A8X6L7G6_TRICU|nr:hypothetical protein TNCT_177371 [Trichonephila clavata]